MKIKVLRKDIPSYVFLLLLAIACIAIGTRMLVIRQPALGAFGIALGLLLVLVPVSMTLRKS